MPENTFCKVILLYFVLLLTGCRPAPESKAVDVLVIGAGAGGTMAGIQAARLGVNTLIIEQTPWLGGMLTAAGVSAIDGNYKLHSGLWEEFRQKLYDYYGGADSVRTGWVSNVLFEPDVGAQLLLDMAEAEPSLELSFHTSFEEIERKDGAWQVTCLRGPETLRITAKIVIDATELGDVAKAAGIPYDAGMEARAATGEDIAPERPNDIIQDLTYVAILKDYGMGVDKTIEKPEGYDPAPFLCTCDRRCDRDSIGRTLWDCDRMMNYGRLPNGKYMINWPIYGNDYYLHLIDVPREERAEALEQAKLHTLRYVYYLQTELGYKHLGIADDVFQTEDGLPFIPYHRESRRIRGLVRFTINDLARPFEQERPLYRTGIAVGDYPVDHHHDAYPDHDSLPDLHFYPVPSYSLPLATLIPKETDDFIVAEKSISVSNIVNGTTRLQPVCLLAGQAAGVLAALSVQQNATPASVPVREVQRHLLNAGAYLLPYVDVPPSRRSFAAVQRIGATGILKGEGKNVGWENQTLFYPDSLLSRAAIWDGLMDFLPSEELEIEGEFATVAEILDLSGQLAEAWDLPSPGVSPERAAKIWSDYGLENFGPNQPASREAFCILLDELIDPFSVLQVTHEGFFLR